MEKYRCIICGAEINEINFGFNSVAFTEKNNQDHIIKCPFCGVGSEFLSKSEDVIRMEKNFLDEKTIKILDHAVKLEIFNGEFYKRAYKMGKQTDIKELFKALGNVEMMHAKIHFNIGGFEKMPTLVNVNYDKYDSDNALLELANVKEEHAVKFYEKYIDEINNKDIVRIFGALCNVEKEHICLTSR